MATPNKYILFLKEANSDKSIWSLQLNNLEVLAGMLAAGIGIMNSLNNQTNNNIEQNTVIPPNIPRYLINIKYNYVQYYLDCDIDISSFRIVNSITEDLIPKISCGNINIGQYGLWLKSNEYFRYSLYGFRTPYFIQGIISICNYFQVDFRNYIFGFPFDAYGNQYALSGYVMSPYLEAYDAPDDDDIDDEENDNENIIESLKKDY